MLFRPERDLQHAELVRQGHGRLDRRRATRPPRSATRQKYDTDVKGFISKAYDEVPRVPMFQPYLNVATQKNISGYQYWFHRQVDYRKLVKA